VTTPEALALPGVLYEQAARFQAELDALLEGPASRLALAHVQAYQAALGDYAALLDKIEVARKAGEDVTPAWLYQRARLDAALAGTRAEIIRFSAYASAEVRAVQAAALQAGAAHAATMGRTAVDQAGLEASFVAYDPAPLEALVGFLADGSPLDELLSNLAGDTTDALRSTLVRGVALGKGVPWMRRRVRQGLDLSGWRAETILRTEAHRAYREAQRRTYLANLDVLAGWVWTATLDDRLCPACLAMDGTLHPLTAILDGHPRCRCAMIPRTKTWEELLGPDFADVADSRPPVRNGKVWLEAQPVTVQQRVLGPAKWRAWRSGRITLDEVVARTFDPAWGTMRRERSLLEITQGRNANYADAPGAVPLHLPR